MFARAQHEAQTEAGDEKRERPLHLRGVIAEPEKNQRDERRGRPRRESQPRQPALVSEPVPQLLDRFLHLRAKQPGLLPLRLKSILLQAPIKRAPTQPQRFRRFSRVAVEPRERLLDQERLDVLEAHVFEPRRIGDTTR